MNDQSEVKEEVKTEVKESPSVVHNIKDYIQPKAPMVKRLQIPTTIPLHRPELPNKLTVTKKVIHRDKDGAHKFSEVRSTRVLSNQEEPYIRKMTIGETWTKLDFGWIQDVGYLQIHNRGGRPFQVIPTKEQIEEELSRIVDVAYLVSDLPTYAHPEKKNISNKRTQWDAPLDKVTQEPVYLPLWVIHPSEGVDGKPALSIPMYLKCRKGQVTVSVFISPN